jgi:hypothetical protein
MFKKITDIFKKKNKNKMSFSDKSLLEVEEQLKNSDFQWIKGENLGMIEKFNGVSEEGSLRFVNFKGGGRINLEIINEFMDIFPATPVIFGSESSSVEPQSSSQTGQIKSTEKSKVNSINYGGSQIGVEESPIYKLLGKQKPNWVNVNISLKLNLPTKSLYNVLISSFEDAESEIANYVTEGIDIEDIKEAVAESIKSSFYDSKKTGQTKKINQLNIINDDEFSED